MFLYSSHFTESRTLSLISENPKDTVHFHRNLSVLKYLCIFLLLCFSNEVIAVETGRPSAKAKGQEADASTGAATLAYWNAMNAIDEKKDKAELKLQDDLRELSVDLTCLNGRDPDFQKSIVGCQKNVRLLEDSIEDIDNLKTQGVDDQVQDYGRLQRRNYKRTILMLTHLAEYLEEAKVTNRRFVGLSSTVDFWSNPAKAIYGMYGSPRNALKDKGKTSQSELEEENERSKEVAARSRQLSSVLSKRYALIFRDYNGEFADLMERQAQMAKDREARARRAEEAAKQKKRQDLEKLVTDTWKALKQKLTP